MAPDILPVATPDVSTKLPAGSSAGDLPLSSTLARFLAAVFQLALILVVIHLFKFEPNHEPNHPFLAVMYLAAGGFVVHAWLPRSFRLVFFSALSLGSAVLLLGWTTAGWIAGLGTGLIALCHLPVPLGYRAVLVAVVGGALACWRAQSVEPFWIFLGSMFMFRLIVYLFDMRHQRERPSLTFTLAYFFPLPNLCFPFFPVLDFKTFCRTYYNDEPSRIYQTGINWIVRGLTHLLAYRIVKHYLLPATHQVTDLPHLLLLLAANYALYLRVSGWFHIITGVLHLFGFNLPRTHDNYFLASSVSDVWRRINIYWKDFMAKVFFYPAFYALSRTGMRLALTIASLGVFIVTWLLHSYQVFWLRAELPLSWHEAILWLSAGALVTIQLQFDLWAKQRPSQSPGWAGFVGEAGAGAALAVRIMGTFLLVSLFWALWTLPQFPARLQALASTGALFTVAGTVTVIGWVLGGVTVGILARLVRASLGRSQELVRQPSLSFAMAFPTAVLLALAAAGMFGDIGLHQQATDFLAVLRGEAATPAEALAVVQGYYEELAETHTQASPLREMPGLRITKPPPPVYTDLSRPADDFLERELIPGWSGEVLGQRLTINRFGMRDREGIMQAKPAGVCRLAFVGSSVVMGFGVGDDEPFTRLLEAHLNGELPANAGRRIEVLNFGMGMSAAIHRHTVLTRKVFAFEPDAVYYVAHQNEFEGTVRHLAGLASRHNKLPSYLDEIVLQAGIGPQTEPAEAESRLKRFGPQIVRGVYGDILQQCRQRGILPVWLYLPIPTGAMPVLGQGAALESSKLIGLAGESGFVVLDLSNWIVKHIAPEVRADKYHPNALGHRLIAECLERALRQHSNALPACARPKADPKK